jgi:hypothetical protein
MQHDRRACPVLFLSAALLALAACISDPHDGDDAPRRPTASVEPARVDGHYKEINTGDFALVDGIAYTTDVGTVVFVTEKAIASSVLAGSTCPMTQARSLALLRNAAYLEVTLDGSGRSKYFASGVQYGGQGREEDLSGWLGGLLGRPWKIAGGRVARGRIAGRVIHGNAGAFRFDLPVSRPGVNEVSMGDRVHGRGVDETRRSPTESEVTASYVELRRAALAKDIEALLRLQGFDANQIAAIRELPGIDADLAAHADHFLVPGDPEEAGVRPGWGQVGGRGTNAKGKAFVNYYEFAPCGEHLVLVSIGENPQ